jgi:hypothetical protein
MRESMKISCQNYVMLNNEMHTFQINVLIQFFLSSKRFETFYVHHQEDNIVKINRSLYKYVYRKFFVLISGLSEGSEIR